MHTAQLKETDRIARKAAWVVNQSGSVTDIARVTRRHKSQPSRWQNGAKSGPAFNALVFIRALSRGEKTTPFPFVTELKVEKMRALVEDRSVEWLIRRFHELRDQREPAAEAAEKVASRGECRQAYRNALKAEAAIQEELAAIDEVLEEKYNVDPREYRGDGYRIIRPIR